MNSRDAASKILTREQAAAECQRLKKAGRTIVFTNGCFDILHAGHVTYLEYARQQGDALVLGLNSDASIRRNKGDKRPIVSQQNRARLLAALECIDIVVPFDEDEPKDLIAALLPDILVKSEDWAHYVSGRDIVEAHGGKVVLAKMVDGLSTTALIQKILDTYAPAEKPHKDNPHV